MFRPGSMRKRWAIVTVAAYAMVLHTLAMGLSATLHAAGATPPATAFQQICYGMAGNGAPTPSTSKAHSVPCALCSLGHASVDVPVVYTQAPRAKGLETVLRFGVERRPILTLEFLSSSRPRAPPAFM